jgi:protoporphyrin/coproporphyrin ferrochelatase
VKYLILNQLGTPQNPDAESVGAYLSEFLMDGNVIKIPRPFRDLLVKGLIVPLRKRKSAAKYRQIWTAEGSPLAVNTFKLQQKLQKFLGADWTVLVGMRYGEPSIAAAFKDIPEHADSVFFLPLYPQYAQATVWSAIEQMQAVTKDREVKTLPVFFSKNWYIQAQSELIKKYLEPGEHLVFSYHGLPVKQDVHAGISYQAQCFETSELLVKKLSVKNYSTAFQSRLGPTRWLAPSTEEECLRLLRGGVKKIKVVCPAFVADCLETIEEIGQELKDEFLKSGGESFELIPCLNDEDLFVQGIAAELQAL